jgi:enamine deaminase RidA (YjgF/YER057c/UK114 family)
MSGSYLALLGVLAALGAPSVLHGQATSRQALNPPSLPPPRGYSHVVIAPAGRRASISGQVAVDSLGAVVGAGDFRAQCVQVFENLGRALRSVGATFADVVSTSMYVTDLSHLAILREVRARYLPTHAPPASTLVQVVALYRPELMIEIAAEAVLPDSGARPATR